MTDRELLEAAAKAAGIALVWSDAERPGYYSEWRGLPQWEYWNPLTDDGDALRLAVKLRLSPLFGDRSVNVMHEGTLASYDGSEEYGTDPDAATRRALVRAAASIWLSSRVTQPPTYVAGDPWAAKAGPLGR